MGWSRIALTALKEDALAPIPSASAKMVSAVEIGLFVRILYA
jgi:hypothetical protein